MVLESWKTESVKKIIISGDFSHDILFLYLQNEVLIQAFTQTKIVSFPLLS